MFQFNKKGVSIVENNNESFSGFYPTPSSLLDKILEGVDWRYVGTVLEPSAGKGNIVDYIEEHAGHYPYYRSTIDIDCIENEPTLQKILIGAKHRLVHDDFLTYHSFKKYDLIIMNPPFDAGDRHLMKALDIQEKTGGDVICILNAATIKNPFSNLRKTLVQRLEDAGASIEYMLHEFSDAERKTDVEIAVIKVHYEEPNLNSNILDNLKRKYYSEGSFEQDMTELAPKDFIEATVKAYELEVEAGIKLIQEYRAIAPKLMSNINDKYAKPMLTLTSDGGNLSVNKFVEHVRMKYWRALFSDRRITGQMTSDQQSAYLSKVNELKDYEVSIYNIKVLQTEMSQNLVHGIEDCIIKLFDELTAKHAWYPECTKNTHYYNGWATNKAWIINKKVILPINGFGSYSWNKDELDLWKISGTLADMEKALNYLDGGLTNNISLDNALNVAKASKDYKNIHLKYFDVTFYKKGTCHIVFRNDELLKKLNIFGSQRKGWLPPSYTKKKYSEMNKEEKAVIDEFEGKESYEKTMNNKEYYLFDTSNIMLLEDKTA